MRTTDGQPNSSSDRWDVEASEAVVITGVGVVSPVGSTARVAFDTLLAGKSGITRVALDLGETDPIRIAGHAAPYDAATVLGSKAARRQAVFTRMAAVAAAEAIKDAALGDARVPSERIATIFGVGMGAGDQVSEVTLTLESHGPMLLSPHKIPSSFPNIAAGVIAIMAQARGPSFCIASACASSGHAIGEAAEMIKRGAADVAITGGADGPVTRLGLAAFNRIGALSKRNQDPTLASRPFDVDRDGFVLAEGAAALILERESHARKRGARIYAQVAGYGASADAYHLTEPESDGAGAASAMSAAIAHAKMNPSEIGYINAHGTSTIYNDVVETTAIKRVFGDHARSLWVSSTKSMTGHLLGAAGALEAVVTAIALSRGEFPPTINLDRPDPRCDLDYIPNVARRRTLDAAITNSFGFGGQNASLVLRRVA